MVSTFWCDVMCTIWVITVPCCVPLCCGFWLTVPCCVASCCVASCCGFWLDRIHGIIGQCCSATGRLISVKPNMQNVPQHQARAREFRKAFKPSPGCVLVAADYSQVLTSCPYTCMAQSQNHLSNPPTRLLLLCPGTDGLHQLMAVQIIIILRCWLLQEMNNHKYTKLIC